MRAVLPVRPVVVCPVECVAAARLTQIALDQDHFAAGQADEQAIDELEMHSECPSRHLGTKQDLGTPAASRIHDGNRPAQRGGTLEAHRLHVSDRLHHPRDAAAPGNDRIAPLNFICRLGGDQLFELADPPAGRPERHRPPARRRMRGPPSAMRVCRPAPDIAPEQRRAGARRPQGIMQSCASGRSLRQSEEVGRSRQPATPIRTRGHLRVVPAEVRHPPQGSYGSRTLPPNRPAAANPRSASPAPSDRPRRRRRRSGPIVHAVPARRCPR